MDRRRIGLLWLTALLVVAIAPTAVSAHCQPVEGLESRNSYCTQSASRPYLNKDNPACARANEGPEGDQPGYDPFESNQANGSSFSANGQVAPLITGVVPDGQLCGTGRDKYAGFNTPTSAWPYRAYEPGTSILYRHSAWAHHPGQIDLYVSKEGFDPTSEALGWDDLESEPLATISTDAVNGQSDEHNSPAYEQQITLPNRTGRMVVASVWRRSDSPEVFYYCSDLVLQAGANGEIYNLGAVEGDVAPPSTVGQSSQETATAAPAESTTTTEAPAAAGETQAEVAGQVVLVPGQSEEAAALNGDGVLDDAAAPTAATQVADPSGLASGQGDRASLDGGSGFPWSVFLLGGIFALLLVILMVLLAAIVLTRRNVLRATIG